MRVLALGVAILCAAPAAAQYVEPEVAVQRLSEKAYPAVAEDEPSIMSTDEFYKLRSKSFSMEEIAVIRIVFKGKWFRSADYLAREKAASLGANGLVLVESIGREDIGFGASMIYRAFRFTDTVGRPVYTKPASEAPSTKPPEAPAGSPFIAPKPAAIASIVSPPPPRKHRHFDWIWTKDASILSHRLGFDAARASRDELEQLKLYVRENFSAAEYKKLLKAYGSHSKITLDFVKRTLE